jgi:DNA sulfur modification protein DndD
VVGFPEEVVSIDKKLKNFQGLKDEKNDVLKKISQEIKQSNIENIKSWEEQRQKYSQEKDQLKVQIALRQRDIERRGNIIRARNSELVRELKKESKYESLLRLLAFCDEGLTCAEEVKDSIMKKIKEEVEERASKQFLALIWKKETYKGLVIDDDYNISIPHISGREALGTLSAGERQVCALSFMAALNSVSGFKVPIIIDTPLGRISREPRKNIAENLPNYLKGTQVALLVTEEEYTPEVRKALSEKVGKTYVINFWEKGMGKMAEVELVK